VNAPQTADRAIEVRRRLADPWDVCRRLGIDEGAKPQARGLMIRCPWHADRSPSCSVREAEDETISVNCFGCGATGDVLDLVAISHRLDVRGNFADVLRLADALAGVDQPKSLDRRLPRPGRTFPPPDHVAALWASCRPIGQDAEVSAWLTSRGLDPGDVESFDLARALPTDSFLPTWAQFRGRSWRETGHRCILPMFDQRGGLASVRARRVADDDGPKTLPPAGYRLGGMVMADALGRQLLATGKRPEFWPRKETLRIIVTEGEPDFLTWATAFPDAHLTAPAVVGIVAGSWTEGVAARIPDGSRVIVRTHHDEAGEAYAGAVLAALAQRRATVVRGGSRDCSHCLARMRGAA